MNEATVDTKFEITFPSYELGEQRLPEQLARAVALIDPTILDGLEIRVWNDPTNDEVRFIAPSQVGFPNNPEALRDSIGSARELNSVLFAEHSIEGDLMVLVFIILHERKHLDHYRSGRIIPYMMQQAKAAIESEANEYAIEELKKMNRQSFLSDG